MNDKEQNVREVIQIDSEIIDNISDLVANHSTKSLLSIFNDLHPADIAELINHLKPEYATYAFNLLKVDVAEEVITDLDENLREKILKFLDVNKITEIVDRLDSDDATDIVSDLPEEIAEHVLENINKESSEDVKELLKYDEESAGGLMSSDFVFVHDDAVIKDAIKEVRKHSEDFDNIYHIYVVNKAFKLKGVVSLKSLLLHPFQTELSKVMEEDLIYAQPEMDQEEVATLMEKYDLVAIPVLDKDGKMLGRITIDDVVDVIQEEAEEDISMMAGLSEEQETSDSIFRISQIRLPWLIIALFLEFIAAILLHAQQESLEAFATAIAFIPVVMAMGGSSGTQAAIVMVRSLTTGEVWFKESFQQIAKEFLVSVLNGLALSALLLIGILLFFQEALSIALLVSASLLAVILFATNMGALIPLLLKKANIDPAIATGPFVTTMNDILGLIIYLTVITYFFPMI